MPPVRNKIKFFSSLASLRRADELGHVHHGITDELRQLLHEEGECQPQFPLSSKIYRIRIPKKPENPEKMMEYERRLEKYRQIIKLSRHFESAIKRTPGGNFIIIEFD